MESTRWRWHRSLGSGQDGSHRWSPWVSAIKWNIGIYCVPEIVAVKRVSGCNVYTWNLIKWLRTPRNLRCLWAGCRPGRAGSSWMEQMNQNATNKKKTSDPQQSHFFRHAQLFFCCTWPCCAWPFLHTMPHHHLGFWSQLLGLWAQPSSFSGQESFSVPVTKCNLYFRYWEALGSFGWQPGDNLRTKIVFKFAFIFCFHSQQV